MMKRILLFFLAFSFSIMPVFLTNSVYGYLPSLFFFIFSLLSVAYAWVIKNALIFNEPSGTKECERDDETAFDFTLYNCSFFILPKVTATFFMQDNQGHEVCRETVFFQLQSYEKKTLQYNVKFNHIGSYRTGLRDIKIHGFMSIISFSVKNEQPFFMYVKPKIYNFNQASLSDAASGDSNATGGRSVKNGMDYTGVREYVSGDSIKSIHWKLSARSANLLTKQFERFSSSGVSVIMDFRAPGYASEWLPGLLDGIVETAVSIAHYAKRYKHPYEMLYLKDGQSQRFAPTQFYHLSEFVSELPSMHAENKEDVLHTFCQKPAGLMENIVLCAAYVTAEMLQNMIAMKEQMKNPVLYYILPHSLPEKEREEKLLPLKLLAAHHIQYHVLNAASDLRRAG